MTGINSCFWISLFSPSFFSLFFFLHQSKCSCRSNWHHKCNMGIFPFLPKRWSPLELHTISSTSTWTWRSRQWKGVSFPSWFGNGTNPSHSLKAYSTCLLLRWGLDALQWGSLKCKSLTRDFRKANIWSYLNGGSRRLEESCPFEDSFLGKVHTACLYKRKAKYMLSTTNPRSNPTVIQ